MKSVSAFVIGCFICIDCCVSSGRMRRSTEDNGKIRKLEYSLQTDLKYEMKRQKNGESLKARKKELNEKMIVTELEKRGDIANQNENKSKRDRQRRSMINITDSSWHLQWHLQPDKTPSMGVYETWQKGYTGKGVVVGLVCDGIETTHSELIDNYNPSLSYDFIENTVGGSYIHGDKNHGTRAAGIIAASKNDKCIIGIAFEATIVSFRVATLAGGYIHAEIAKSFTYNNNEIDIYNNEYGRGVGHGSGYYPECELFRSGRNGKGSILVFMAGSDGEKFDDCNTVEMYNSMYTIAVNAMAPDGSPSAFAEECTSVMVATYAGQHYGNGTKIYLLTTDINNTCTARRTASGSVASGILALTLQANVSYGFGVMNAERLVEKAIAWRTVPERLACTSGTLQVRVLFKAEWREHTEIHLVSPQGTDSRILRQRKHDLENTKVDWTFMSLHHWGENPSGNWSIRMDDFLNCDNEMYLYNWTLTVYGTITNPLEGIPNNGTLGGYCDGVTLCTDGTDCLLDSNICVDCTVPGHRILDSFCVKDGYGYCDITIPCKDEQAWCNTDNFCEICTTGYRRINGICKQDGMLGGYCDDIKLCEESDVACDSETNLCMNCTNGYHIVDDFCKEDGVWYCYTETPCIVTDTVFSCYYITSSCVNCLYYADHRVLEGFCIKDGMIDGYCNSETPCVTFAAACFSGYNICAICYAGNTIVDGFCIEDDASEAEVVETDPDSYTQTVAGIVIAGFATGVLINAVLFIVVLQKALIAKAG